MVIKQNIAAQSVTVASGHIFDDCINGVDGDILQAVTLNDIKPLPTLANGRQNRQNVSTAATNK